MSLGIRGRLRAGKLVLNFYVMLWNIASEPDIGFPGWMSTGLESGEPQNRSAEGPILKISLPGVLTSGPETLSRKVGPPLVLRLAGGADRLSPLRSGKNPARKTTIIVHHKALKKG